MGPSQVLPLVAAHSLMVKMHLPVTGQTLEDLVVDLTMVVVVVEVVVVVVVVEVDMRVAVEEIVVLVRYFF